MIEQARRDLKERNRRVQTAVWPEHWHALVVFQGMHTQWNFITGLGGAVRTGLNYASLPHVIACSKSSVEKRLRQRRGVLFQQLQVMEIAVLRMDKP